MRQIHLKGNHWDDLRISADQVTEQGSNPPKHAKYKDDGTLVPGSAQALNFLSNSQGYINIPADSTIDFRGKDTSVALWFRPNLNTNNNTRLLACGAFALAFMSDLDRLRFYTVQIGNRYSAAGSVNVNDWNHIVVTFADHGAPYTYTVYCNGVQLMQYSQNNLPQASSGMQIVDEKFFNSVDYISLWDKTLTEAEVLAQHNNGAGVTLVGTETDLDGLWKLDDGSGTTLADATSNANDGSVVGGTEDTHWEWIAGHVGAIVPGSHGVHLPFFLPDTEQEVFFNVQMPHDWEEGSTIMPHIHWVPTEDSTGSEVPRFGLEFLTKPVNGIFGDTTLIYTTVGNTSLVKDRHYVHGFNGVTGINMAGKKISSMLICRLFRDGTNALDTYQHPVGFLEMDFHYLRDSHGSEEEYVKTH